MAISYSFMDNCSYGADDINSVFSKLTTQGVSLFNYSDSQNPLVSLNQAVNSLVSPGVEYFNKDALKLTYNISSKKCVIMQGNAFMPDGSIVTVDDAGYDISDAVAILRNKQTSDIYVCFYRNMSKNSIDVSVADDKSLYENSMSIKIGIIKADGTVFDSRSYAKSKLSLATRNVYEEITIDKFKIDYYKGAKTCYFSIPVNNVMADYAIFADNYFELNHINTTTGNELTYKLIEVPQGGYYGALNLVGGELQFWAYFTYSGWTNYDEQRLILL